MEQESSSTKRAKPPGTANSQSQVANCLVDGCDADLSLGREYHRRHKVCEAHSKTPIVTIAGREQRFCQQCSRFHSLVEFDESKRSCRKRLDGHNRRRRKPQPESVAAASNSSLLFLNHPSPSGARFPAFGCAQIIPPSVFPPTWPGFIKTENDLVLCSNQRRTESFLKFPFKGVEQHHQQQHHYHHLHSHEFSPISSMPNDPRFLNDRRNLQVVETQGAPSLLSTSPQATEELNLIHRYGNEATIPPNTTQAIAQGGFNYGPFHQFPQDIKPLVSSAQNHGTTLHFPEMFQHGEGSSSGGGPHHQTLSFMWE